MNFAAKKTIQDVAVLNQETKGTTEDYKHVIDSDVKIGLGDQNDFHGNIKIKWNVRPVGMGNELFLKSKWLTCTNLHKRGFYWSVIQVHPFSIFFFFFFL